MRLQTLGGLRLEGTGFSQPKPLILLSYLNLEGAKPRRHLAELFWPAGNRMKSLSMTLTRLRQAAAESVAADAGRAWTTLSSDATTLLELLEQSRWQRAVDHYAGAFLEGVQLEDGSVELEEWIYATREYLAGRVQHALLNLAEEAAREQDFARAGELAERAWRLPGLAGSEAGGLQRLYPLLSAAGSPLAPRVRQELEEYGEALQLARDEARALFRPAGHARTNLPAHLTSFVGRERERRQLRAWLASARLVTVLGAAGAGKTRLVLEAAHEAHEQDRFDGVYFAGLETLTDPEQLAPHLLGALGLNARADGDPLWQLRSSIGDRAVLLVLDNLEHLLPAIDALAELLRHCPNLRLLVTSRERLGLAEEHLLPLEGLPWQEPDGPDEIHDGDALRLFAERARQLHPGFDLEANRADVLRVCRLVEGLPLGLELAASWVRLMSCRDIADEIEANLDFLESSLRNAPGRHRSIRAAFEHSWKLLGHREQDALCRLSVFQGGFRRDAAAEVAGATIPVLASLVDKSLLRVLPDGRYDRHSLLHRYTEEKLAADPVRQREVRDAHAAFFVRLAEGAEPQLRGRHQARWFAILQEENDNARAALRWLESRESGDLGPRLAVALSDFWQTHGFAAEARGHLERALTSVPDRVPLRVRLLLKAGNLAVSQGEYAAAGSRFGEAGDLAGALDDKALRSLALQGLALVAGHREGVGSALPLLEESLALARESGDAAVTAQALRFLGGTIMVRADYRQARLRLEEAVTLHVALQDDHGRAKCLTNLATTLTELGEYEQAHALNEESLAHYRAVGDRYGIAVALLNLGRDAVLQGRTDRSIELQQESLTLFREIGEKRMVVLLLNNLADDHRKLGDYGRSLEYLEESLELLRSLEDAELGAHALKILGDVRWERGDPEQAFEHYQACLALCRDSGDNWMLMRVLDALARWYRDRGELARARASLLEAGRLAREANHQKALVEVLETQASLHLAEGAPEQAVQAWARAQALREALGLQAAGGGALEAARASLAEAAFASAWERGRQLEVGQVLGLLTA